VLITEDAAVEDGEREENRLTQKLKMADACRTKARNKKAGIKSDSFQTTALAF
jgi:hypothetical protein